MADDLVLKATDFPPTKKARKELRKYSKIPVHICENHDAVLYPIYRAIGSKHLPFEGITLLHFDSHPDLTIPTSLPDNIVFNIERLLELISIADWILPAVYAGHINRVVWVKPDWSDQIQGCKKTFFIGKHKQTGFLRVTCCEEYFVEELLYAPLDQLENTKELQLDIVSFDSHLNPLKTKNINNSTDTDKQDSHGREKLDKDKKHNFQDTKRKTDENINGKLISKDVHIFEDKRNIDDNNRDKILENEQHLFKELGFNFQDLGSLDGNNVHSYKFTKQLISIVGEDTPFILDVDMDFFSTKNPFKELFTEDEFQSLADIYKFNGPTSNSDSGEAGVTLEECITEREKQLDLINKTLKYAGELENNCVVSKPMNVNSRLLQLIQDIRRPSDGEKPDIELIHSTGMTIDLPHHISTKQEIHNLLNQFYVAMAMLPKPVLVTMARSSYDEYTPPHQIDYIQNSLVKILGVLYKQECLDVLLDY